MLEIRTARGRLAAKYKLKRGEAILAFDGHRAVDNLDYIFYDDMPSFDMTVRGKDGAVREIKVEKKENESLNLTFVPDDSVRTCRNKCIFCFVDQMGGGMRDSLYVKDDDYTMSFMCGNFVTLTNLDDSELERIARLHLSPLYVSVHTMDGELRCKMLNNRFAGKIGAQLKTLTEAGITVHCQAVIVPGMNDGANLEYTARKLFEMYPRIADLAVVPTGLTKFREGLTDIDDVTKEGAAAILGLCDKLNAEFGVNFVLPADEYFIKADQTIKPASFYGDFAQVENGVGMTAKFIAEFEESLRPAALKKPTRVAVITGVSAAKIIGGACEKANSAVKNLHAFALPVENKYFGSTVTCTGLLTGGDIAAALEKVKDKFDAAVIPANALKEFEDVFLDDMTLKQLKKLLKGKKIIVNKQSGTFFESLLKA